VLFLTASCLHGLLAPQAEHKRPRAAGCALVALLALTALAAARPTPSLQHRRLDEQDTAAGTDLTHHFDLGKFLKTPAPAAPVTPAPAPTTIRRLLRRPPLSRPHRVCLRFSHTPRMVLHAGPLAWKRAPRPSQRLAQNGASIY